MEKVLERLHQLGLPAYLAKPMWYAPQQELVVMAVSRLGVRPSQAKINAVAEPSRAAKVKNVM